MLVGNLEVLAPLLGLFGKRNLYGPIPIEIGAFFDAGVAWDSGSKPDLFGGDRFAEGGADGQCGGEFAWHRRAGGNAEHAIMRAHHPFGTAGQHAGNFANQLLRRLAEML